MTTEDGSFLRRWSRRKEEARQAEADPAPPPEPEAGPGPDPEAEAAPFDPASLPPLESLGPDSDYTAFLRREVPRALRSAALRRAWASQPAIVAHRPLVEYDWNWNAPGYGALRPGDEAGPLIEALFGHLRAKAAPPDGSGPDAPGPSVEPSPEPEPEPEPEPPAPVAEPEPPVAEPPSAAPPRPEAAPSAPRGPSPEALLAQGSEATPPGPAPRRRHGGAAPV